jgi:hypothetical protein
MQIGAGFGVGAKLLDHFFADFARGWYAGVHTGGRIVHLPFEKQ